MSAVRLLGVYGEPRRRFVAGEGVWLVDEDGRRYVDLLAGIAAVSLGHAHPAVSAAIAAQAGRLVQVSNFFTCDLLDPALAALAHPLASLGDVAVFFANSGAEANEAAFKLVRRARAPRTQMVALVPSFHGRTFGALSLTGQVAKREPFAPLVGDVVFVEATDARAVRDAVAAPATAGVIVEPIAGESGVRVLDPEVVRALEEGRQASGALLIADEVQAGLGRAGAWLASEIVGLRPDIVTLAKALGNGYPVGAMVVREAWASALRPGDHGSTCGGNPLALAVVRAVVETMVELDVPRRARERGSEARRLAAALPGVVGVSGQGLMLGVELDAPIADAVVEQALDEGVVVNATGPTRLRIVPPLVISTEELELGFSGLERALRWVRGRS